MDPRRLRAPFSTVGLIALVMATALFASLFFAFPVLYDTDSYYHLGIARLYFERGQLHDLPWARFSLMARGFGDKELLFHWLAAPFAGLLGTAGGRLALALLDGALVALLTVVSVRAIGRWGLLVPTLVCLGSQDVLARIIRLRPELLSLLLLLVALELAAQRRHRLLGLVAFVYALSYTAFHALLALCLAWFVQQGWGRRRWQWRLLLYPVVGVGLGLLVHPDFPHNLVIWKVQSVDFFLLRHQLDVGAEIGPSRTDALLRSNLGWLVGLGFLWLLSRARWPQPVSPPPTGAEQVRRDLAIVAAVGFTILYLLGRRFALYAVPFVTLAFVVALAPRFPLPRGRSALRLGGLGLVLALVLVPAGSVLFGLATARAPLDREEDWSATGEAIPPGARVAATWGLGQLFVYFAPQGSYLNVLDPVFMAVPHPRAYAAQHELFASRVADIPLLLWQELDSDHLLVSRLHRPPSLLERLEHDPRLELVHDGLTRLYRVVPARNGTFLRRWRVAPAQGVLPSPLPAPALSPVTYPLLTGAGAALEGFVDLLRLDEAYFDAHGCAAFISELAAGPGLRYELAPWGPTEVRLDGRLVAGIDRSLHAILDRGVELALDAGGQLEVRTCREPETARGGFYLRQLSDGDRAR